MEGRPRPHFFGREALNAGSVPVLGRYQEAVSGGGLGAFRSGGGANAKRIGPAFHGLLHRFVLSLLLTFAAYAALSCTKRKEVGTETRSRPPLMVDVGAGMVRYPLEELRAKLDVASVTVFSPVYGKNKTYEGFWLRDILTLAGLQAGPAKFDELTFICDDGYEASAALSLVESSRMLVAFREAMGDFEDFRQGKETVNPGPYYVVGTTAGSYDRFPWPNRVESIEAVSFEEKYRCIYPLGAPAGGPVARGYQLFRSTCLACHSINLQGGELGPELNIPQNITAYRSNAFLAAFIADPGKFRARSKMPGFDLPAADIQAIIEYLGYMGRLQESSGAETEANRTPPNCEPSRGPLKD